MNKRAACFEWLIFALLGSAFLLSIISGILGLWKNIFWWIITVSASVILILTSQSKLNIKAFKWLSKIIVVTGFLVIFPLYSVTTVLNNQSIAKNLVSSKEIEYFRNVLDQNYSYTELYQWENSKLHWNNSSSMLVYSDPIQIYEYGQARCGGYAILYAELCISQGYDAQLIINVFGNHAWTEIKLNGTWTRVDPSPTGASMSDNIGYPLFYEERWNTPPILALAFDESSVVDVTGNYRSDRWSLLSWSTVIISAMGAWLAACILIIWKVLLRPIGQSLLF